MRFDELKFNPDGSIDRGGPNAEVQKMLKNYKPTSAASAAPTAPVSQPSADTLDVDIPNDSLESGPPYPESDAEAVKELQKQLSAAGYSVGSTGQDGKYGPRTARAVRAFKKDYKIAGSGNSIEADDIAVLAMINSGDIPKIASSNAAGSSAAADSRAITKRTEFGSLANDSVTSGKVGMVLDLIAGPESGGSYDAVYPGRRRPQILSMTLDELFDDMRARVRDQIRGGADIGSSASGRYQYIRSTLESVVKSMGLDTSKEVFSPELQDEIAVYHLRRDHGMDRWLDGDMSDERFLNKLAGTWAGIPKTSGRSNFAGDRIGNKAGITSASALSALSDIRGLA